MKVILCTDSAVQGNDSELIPTVRIENQHSIGQPTCQDFPRFVIISEKSQLEVGNRWWWWRFLEKKRLLKGKCSKTYSGRIHHVTESRLVRKFREIWLTGNRQSRALFTWQKKQNFRKVSRSHFCADRAQNLSGPNNILGVPQISSKSVHFRRSYSWTSEHRWNAPQSISNTRRSLSNKPLMRNVHTDSCTPGQSSHLFAELGLKKKYARK